jgi:hypothetical protein
MRREFAAARPLNVVFDLETEIAYSNGTFSTCNRNYASRPPHNISIFDRVLQTAETVKLRNQK